MIYCHVSWLLPLLNADFLFSMLAFHIFYFLHSSFRDEKDTQGLTLEITEEVESLRNSHSVSGARVGVTHRPARLTGWKRRKLETTMMKCCTVNICGSRPTKSLFLRHLPRSLLVAGGQGDCYHGDKDKNETVHMTL